MTLALATQPGPNGANALDYNRPAAPAMVLDDVWQLANAIAASRMFGVADEHQAFCLLMLAQAEGLHPMTAVRRYHVIKGQPSMKAAAIQAEFQSKGGAIRIIERSPKAARATFSHPTHQPEPIEISFTLEDAKRAQLTGNPMYSKYPEAMLWNRLVASAVRTIYPGIVVGIYSEEEVIDMQYTSPPPPQIEVDRAPRASRARPADFVTPAPTKTYAVLARDFVEAINGTIPEGGSPLTLPAVHKEMIHLAIEAGKSTIAPPTSTAPAVKELERLYREDWAWVLSEMNAFGVGWVDAQEVAQPEDETQEVDEALDAAYPAEPGADG
jgi:hypothetical protein